MKFNKEHKVIIDTLDACEASAFIKFLESEIICHWEDIKKASELISIVKKKFEKGE